MALVPIKDTYINFVLDRSGSMWSSLGAVINGFNKAITELRRNHAQANVTLTVFDTRVETVYTSVLLKDVPPLTRQEYNVGEETALYDAIGKTICAIEQRVGLTDRVIVVIMTDGYENASREFREGDIARMIREREGRGNWTFTYLSADRLATSHASRMGIRIENVSTYDRSGTDQALQLVSKALVRYTKGQAHQVGDFYNLPATVADTPGSVQRPRRRWER